MGRDTRTLRRGQVTAAAVVTGMVALGLAAASAAGSYDSLWHLATAHNVPLPRLNPVELDGGLVGVTVIDVTLTWCGYPLAWLRMIARLFGAGTVVANAAAGWPDPVGVFLRVFAPALVVVVTEAARSVLLRRRRDEAGERGVPLARWLLAPWPTFRLWRRMKLWDIRDYRAAVDMELSRHHAIAALSAHYGEGRDWRREAPSDVAWMLRAGLRMEEALARVAQITRIPSGGVAGASSGGGSGDALEHAAAPAPDASGDVPGTTPRTRSGARSAHASRPALKLTAARSRSMPPDKLAEHVEAMLGEYGDDVSINKIKTDLSVGTDKAKAALEIARSSRARVVPIGERRQA